MTETQRQAVQNYRKRLSDQGLARFEVLGRDGDRDLIRLLARRLAEGTSEAAHLRLVVNQAVKGNAASKGHILEALRASPLVGTSLNLDREASSGRDVAL